MRARTVYFVVLAVFYLSIPIDVYVDSISMLLKGYAPGVAFRQFDPENFEMRAAYDDAYRDAFSINYAIGLVSDAVWLVTFCFSMVVIYLRDTERKIVVPYKLDIISATISFILGLVIFLGATALGGWPLGLL